MNNVKRALPLFRLSLSLFWALSLSVVSANTGAGVVVRCAHLLTNVDAVNVSQHVPVRERQPGDLPAVRRQAADVERRGRGRPRPH